MFSCLPISFSFPVFVVLILNDHSLFSRHLSNNLLNPDRSPVSVSPDGINFLKIGVCSVVWFVTLSFSSVLLLIQFGPVHLVEEFLIQGIPGNTVDIPISVFIDMIGTDADIHVLSIGILIDIHTSDRFTSRL